MNKNRKNEIGMTRIPSGSLSSFHEIEISTLALINSTIHWTIESGNLDLPGCTLLTLKSI